jgi:hypothetical protein
MSGSVTAVTQMWSRNGGEFTLPSDSIHLQTTGQLQRRIVLSVLSTPIFRRFETRRVCRNMAMHTPQSQGTYVESVQPEKNQPYHVDRLRLGMSALRWMLETLRSIGRTQQPQSRLIGDFDGNAILTANGEQVEGLTVDIADQVVVIRRKFTSINTYSIAAYRHATNSDTFSWMATWNCSPRGVSGAKTGSSLGHLLNCGDVTARIQFRYPYMGANTGASVVQTLAT